MSDDPRMGEPGTARHALWWALWDGYIDTIKASLIDDYAHELAEQIRNSEELCVLTGDYMGDCNAAADLIDPKVEQ